MKIERIAHAAYNVKDMQKEVDYYCGVLGFTDAFEMEREGKPWIRYLRIAHGQFLELFYDRQDDTTGTAYNHLCLEVDDIYAMADHLRALGLLTSDVRKGTSGNLQCWSADPEGNRVEFMQVCPDSLQHLADVRAEGGDSRK